MSNNKKLIEMSALGRSFSLGSLYNYVDDSVLPNIRLWDDVSCVTESQELDDVDVCFDGGDIVEEAATLPFLTIKLGNVDHHSVSSLMAGLVEKTAKGAWRYGTDKVNWSADPVARRADAIVYCRRSTKKKWMTDPLSEELEVICQPKVLVNKNITHVVVAITYGAEAICLFSSRSNCKMEATSKKTTRRTMDYARCFAKNLRSKKSCLGPLQDEEGDEEDGGQSLTDIDVDCTIYNSLKKSKNDPRWTTGPTAEQFDICRRILRQPLKKSTPLKVWLYPLRRLQSIGIGKKLMNPIDVTRELVIKIEFEWNRLVRIRNMLDSFSISTNESKWLLRRHQQNISDLCASVDDFASRFRAFLYKTVIGIRQGAMSDVILAECLEEMESRPELNPTLVARWLTQQMDELRFLERLATLPGVALVCTNELLERNLRKLGKNELAVVLHVPSLSGRSKNLVSEMALLVNKFDPLEERPFKMATPAANSTKKANMTCLDEKVLFETAENFSSWVVEHNKETECVKYVVFYDEKLGEKAVREKSPFTRLYQYNSGSLDFSRFEIPRAPGNIEVDENKRGVLTISWDSEEDNAHFDGYLVQYCSTDDHSLERWLSCDIQGSNTITLRHLQFEEKYIFRVATLTPGGRSPFGPPSLPITVDPVCRPPENLQCKLVTDTSIQVTWTYNNSLNRVLPSSDDDDDCSSVISFSSKRSAKDELSINSFAVECWIENLQESTYLHRSTTGTSLVLEPLSAGTTYCIQVRAECVDSSGSKLFSPPSTLLKVETLIEPERVALSVRRESKTCSTPSTNGMRSYQVPLKKQTRSISNTGRVGRFYFGEPKYAALFGPHRQRTILMLGATGSGKSTLINAMINYILGVEWDDDFRFKLIDEGATKSQAHSQTDLVTTYDLYERKGSRLNYSLTVIDTPGFGDTRGMEADKKIMQQIQEYFQCRHGVVQLEAVCFVVQAALARLTATQQYIFDSILSIFGEDIKENIRLMVTFADSAQPPVLGAVKEAKIPTPVDPRTGLPVHHKFNNSIFFESKKNDEETDEFNKTYFELAVSSFDEFFDDLGRMEARSLTLTREVLEERKRLEALVEGLVLRTEWKLTKNDELQQVLKLLKENKDQMEANKESEFEVEVLVPKSIDISRSGQFTTNCQKCTTTCHFPCRQSSDEDKHKCSVMGSNGSCMVCGCHWSNHFNQKYRYEMAKEKLKRSSDAILKQYLGAKNEAATHEQKMEAIQKQMDENEKQFNDLMIATFPHINRLNEIALRPHVFSAPDYIDMMISNENQEHRPGYQQRVASLQKVRKLAEMTARLLQNHRTQPRGNAANGGGVINRVKQWLSTSRSDNRKS